MVEDECGIARLPRVIKPPAPVQFGTTGPEDHHCRVPATATGFVEKALYIVRPGGAFEAMQNQENRSTRWTIEMVEVDEVSIVRFQALDSSIMQAAKPEKFPPKRLEMAVRQPPGG